MVVCAIVIGTLVTGSVAVEGGAMVTHSRASQALIRLYSPEPMMKMLEMLHPFYTDGEEI